MLLVMIGHSLNDLSFGPEPGQIIYSFHVPLFFMISGFLQGDIINYKEFYIKKLRRLMAPFLVYAVLCLSTFGVTLMKKGGYSLKAAIAFSSYVYGYIMNHPLWFLIVLFEIFVLCGALRMHKYNIAGLIAAICILLSGKYILQLIPFDLCYFGLNRAVICAGFFVSGMLLKKVLSEKLLSEKTGSDRSSLTALLVICININIITGLFLNTKVSVFGWDFGESYPAFLAGALSGSVAMIVFCRLFMDRQGWISSLGRYSIIFLGTQYYMIRLIRYFLASMGTENSKLYDYSYLFFMFSYAVLLPYFYDAVKKKIPFIAVLNGEW